MSDYASIVAACNVPYYNSDSVFTVYREETTDSGFQEVSLPSGFNFKTNGVSLTRFYNYHGRWIRLNNSYSQGGSSGTYSHNPNTDIDFFTCPATLPYVYQEPYLYKEWTETGVILDGNIHFFRYRYRGYNSSNQWTDHLYVIDIFFLEETNQIFVSFAYMPENIWYPTGSGASGRDYRTMKLNFFDSDQINVVSRYCCSPINIPEGSVWETGEGADHIYKPTRFQKSGIFISQPITMTFQGDDILSYSYRMYTGTTLKLYYKVNDNDFVEALGWNNFIKGPKVGETYTITIKIEMTSDGTYGPEICGLSILNLEKAKKIFVYPENQLPNSASSATVTYTKNQSPYLNGWKGQTVAFTATTSW